MALIRLGPFGIVPAAEPAEENHDQKKPDDQKPNDQKHGDQKKLNDKIRFSDKINFFPWSKEKIRTSESESSTRGSYVLPGFPLQPFLSSSPTIQFFCSY
jgi:hypothetical protein